MIELSKVKLVLSSLSTQTMRPPCSRNLSRATMGSEPDRGLPVGINNQCADSIEDIKDKQRPKDPKQYSARL